ncbi:LysR substrate-binding domain-containing protein [Clostridium sp. SYSU_GA19001]|uniref:LysR substrate-binding domain-containing protein n=1 Tax=Clostridium caldaquaticum TaxID=2940653 RepID=UPI0020777FE5|nr:LysR substrate-binding domain-containing protein [Clostridium caldaquaticum]MCM8711201.1 LysR substrate-binding domain-containing protein [Clostridium caldaquaticum]
MNYKKITLLQIEYFLAVARQLNFTEAAKSLYVSQPSLSKQIALLEQEIGVPLLLRTRRNVRLTPAGAVLFNELSNITEYIENAIDKCKQPGLGENSTISIGCLDGMDTSAFLPVIIRKFQKQYPQVTFVFERHTFKTLREKLINGSLDIVFTLSFELDNVLGVLSDEIYKVNSSIVMSSQHPMASSEHLSLEDVKAEDFVLISRDESPKGFDSVIAVCRKHGFTPNVVKQLPNVESLLLSVELGLGITILDSSVRIHNKNELKFYKIEDDSMSIVIAWKRENLNPAVSLFVNSALKGI